VTTALREPAALVLSLLFCVHPLAGICQTVSGAQTLATIAAIAQKYQGETICSQGATVREGAAAVTAYADAHPEKHGEVTNKDMYDALVEEYPCPFNPHRVPARRATAADLIGYWALAADSRQLSPMIFKSDLYPARCQYFGFYADGDLRMLSAFTKDLCSEASAKDFSRTLPKTINWRIDELGLLEVTRSDQPITEKWDVFVVTNPFTQRGSSFNAGDVLMYLSQYNNDKTQGTGTLYFRHVQRLPVDDRSLDSS